MCNFVYKLFFAHLTALSVCQSDEKSNMFLTDEHKVKLSWIFEDIDTGFSHIYIYILIYMSMYECV